MVSTVIPYTTSGKSLAKQNSTIEPDVLHTQNFQDTLLYDCGKKSPYPFAGGAPDYADPLTWRDMLLEYCISYPDAPTVPFVAATKTFNKKINKNSNSSRKNRRD